MPGASACPETHSLQQLLLGQLAGEEVADLEVHLLGCERCLAAARTLSTEDALVKALRIQGDTSAIAENVLVQRLMGRLKGLAQLLGGPTAPSEELQTLGEAGTETQETPLSPRGPDDSGRLGPYLLIRVLGTGGMGVVYEADDEKLQRRVALKVLKPELRGKPAAAQRFLREARLAAAVKHDHIVTIYAVDEDRGIPFLAMEYLEGKTLEQELRDGWRPQADDILRLGRQIAAGLAAAHEVGLIHRDVKPSNLWLEHPPDRVKILDFGLARAVGSDSLLTLPGSILGTPAFMAPEQVRGETVDARCDLFSLGCVLYLLTTGEFPFHGPDILSTLFALAVKEPKPPRDLNPDVPAALSMLVMRLLQKEADARPATAREVERALAAIAQDLSAHAAAAPPGTLPPRSASRRLRFVLLAGGIFVALVLAFFPPWRHVAPEVPQSHREPEEQRPIATPLADSLTPFVVVSGNERHAFATFTQALAERHEDAVIEIHGNGPYRLGPIRQKGAGLHLRAAPGYRPRILADETVTQSPWLAIQDAKLILEGCDFVSPPIDGVALFDGGGAPWEIRNCRLLRFPSLGTYEGAKLCFRDCLLHSAYGMRLGARSELQLDNNTVHLSSEIELAPPGGQRVRLTQNTFYLNASVDGVLLDWPRTPRAAPVTVTASGNLFAFDTSLSGQAALLQFHDAEWSSLVRWQGRDNLYAGLKPAVISRGPDEREYVDVSAWNKFLGKPEEGSRTAARVSFRFTPDDPSATRALIREEVERLRREEKLSDLGPDWDLLGPGQAYVRALAMSGQLVAKDRRWPFVRIRAGQTQRGFRTLQDAVQGVVNDDIIEIRTDGPVVGCHLDKPVRLTIRAAPGYHPVLENYLGASEQTALTIEGIHFRKSGLSGRVIRLANCSFEQSAFDASFSSAAEIVNSVILADLSPCFTSACELAVRNCVLGAFDLRMPAPVKAQLTLDHCVLWNPQARLPWDPLVKLSVGQGELVVHVRQTLLDSGGILVYPKNLTMHWNGSANVYRIGGLDWLGDGAIGLSAWKKRFQSPEENSRELDPLIFHPRQWELLPQSAGYRQGPDGKDYGADVRRVATP